jgi:hypothetical protein
MKKRGILGKWVMQPMYYGQGAEELFGAYARAFVARFASGQRLEDTIFCGFAGRVLRGVTSADFLTLTDNPLRRVVFLTDAAALGTLIGSDGWEILKQIGYADAFIAGLLARQTRFKVALFPEVAMRAATWDNLLDLASEAYPEWHAKMDRARPVLKASASPLPEEAAEVRAFLQAVLNVNRLFAGDGYTRREGDPLRRVHPEYVIRNCPLAAMGTYCLIAFPVRAP